MKYLLLIVTLAAFMSTATATAPTGSCCGGPCCLPGNACCAK